MSDCTEEVAVRSGDRWDELVETIAEQDRRILRIEDELQEMRHTIDRLTEKISWR